MSLTQAELQKRFETNIERYPCIKKYLSQSLSVRVQQSDPLLCTPIRMLVQAERHTDRLDRLEELLDNCTQILENPEEIFVDLRGDDQKYDRKLLDVEVEFFTLDYLCRKLGVLRGCKIPEQKGAIGKVPDFILQDNGTGYVVEVKNVNRSLCVTYLFLQLESKSVSQPDIYDKWTFRVDVRIPPRVENQQKQFWKATLDQALADLDQAIRKEGMNGERSLTHQNTSLGLQLRVEWLPAVQFGFVSFLYYPVSSKKGLFRLVSPFYRKIESKAREAQRQIDSFQKHIQRDCHSHIVICADLTLELPRPITEQDFIKRLCYEIGSSWNWLHAGSNLWFFALGALGTCPYQLIVGQNPPGKVN